LDRFVFTWDPRKRESNLRKHGIDLADGSRIFECPLLHAPDLRYDYGESRWIGIGQLDGRAVVVAFAEQDDGSTIRLISIRKALAHERIKYEQALADALAASRPTGGR
jgi:uncharacterized DUF497 family protein